MLDSTSSGLHDLPRHLKMPSQRIVVCESVTTSPGAVRPLMLHHGFGQRSTDWLTDGPCRSSTLLQSWISSLYRVRPTGVIRWVAISDSASRCTRHIGYRR